MLKRRSVPEGIDIMTKGVTSSTVAATGRLVTMPHENLGSRFNFQLEVLQGVPPHEKEGRAIPASFFGGRAEPLRTKYTKADRNSVSIEDLIPIQPGDGLWLLHQIVLQIYPNGGELYCGNPTHRPGSGDNSIWAQLVK